MSTRRPVSVGLVALMSAALLACGGHSARTIPMRTALDQGQPRKAITAINKELDVKKDSDLPKKLQGDDALLVLDRASIQQSLVQFKESQRDFEAADNAIDMLDLSRNATDEIGKYMFSDSSGRYKAPPYEKLLVNTLNMVNYLERGDLSGAKVEARRVGVYTAYFRDKLKADNAVLGLAGLLAGFSFEKSGDTNEALRFYDDALQFGSYSALADSARTLLPQSNLRTPRLRELEKRGAPSVGEGDVGDLLIVVGYGRVPHKVPQRLPIGLALTYFSALLSPTDVAAANRLAAQGLVTWVNYPSLAPAQGNYETPRFVLDGHPASLAQAVDVAAEVKKEWSKIEGPIVVSAITRLIARYAAGRGVQEVVGRDNLVGLLASLGTQATLSALDTPDTRSWETLPARVAVARLSVPAGKHVVRLEARGVSREQSVEVAKGGWALVSLMALR